MALTIASDTRHYRRVWTNGGLARIGRLICDRRETEREPFGARWPTCGAQVSILEEAGVARTTIRRAIAYLRDQAAIRIVPGRGAMSRNADPDRR
jgi:DNA-binding FadR family transcriptional regulator